MRTDLEVMKLLAVALDRGKFIEDEPARALEELGRASAGGQADLRRHDVCPHSVDERRLLAVSERG